MTQKILARHAGLPAVEPGELIEAKLDLVLGNDVTTPPAIDVFEKTCACEVFDRNKVALVPDHFTPNKDIKSADNCKKIREFAKSFGVKNYYEIGDPRMGVEHVILPENGLVAPGDAIDPTWGQALLPERSSRRDSPRAYCSCFPSIRIPGS